MSQYLERAAGRLHYRIDGNEQAPWLMLSNSLGVNLGMWAPQMDALLRHFRVLRYDTRGHGNSELPAPACSIDDLAQDAIELLDHLGIAQTHFCGLSMGGMTGMALASRHPARIGQLVLCNTSPYMGPPSDWEARIALVRDGGMAAIADAVISRWFTGRFQAAAPDKISIVRQMLLQTSPAGYIACCTAIRDMDQRERVKTIGNATLVIAGAHDPATPPQDGRAIAACIAGAEYVELDAAHLSNWEQADVFTRHLVEFLLT